MNRPGGGEAKPERAPFRLAPDFTPCGDQPRAIEDLVRSIEQGVPAQVLLGVTGSGKTFTVANVIARLGRPALVIAPNKTLAAQLHDEFRDLFPENAVEYFVSYYDYYQPEAYVPSSDTYIEKDASINDEIDKMRHSATRSVLTRRDVIVVASVSCIYGIGAPEDYGGILLEVEAEGKTSRDVVLRRLVDMQYARNDIDFHRGTFRVRGDVVEIFPAYEEERAVRVEFFGDTIEAISEVDPLRGQTLRRLDRLTLFPASHYVTPEDKLRRAVETIRDELGPRLVELKREGKLLEAQRLETRTMFDIEMLQQMGFCPGIENYSRHLDGRAPGEPPSTLIDYFPPDFLLVVDESHVTVPQVGGMYRGDRSRKETLVEYGFRLPSALDNRPLKFEEWRERVHQAVYVSATPGSWELGESQGVVVEQIIRPTGLMDPEIEVRPAGGQVDDLFGEIRARADRAERVLVTTLTKRMAEDLSEYYRDSGLRVKYLHSDVQTLERVEIIRDLRLGKFDTLIGINLLREGLDIPEVSLVAILDADKEGFLRSERSLIQTAGRAARNLAGRVIFYADTTTGSMAAAIRETNRRREIQAAYNREHGIMPESVRKNIRSPLGKICDVDYVTVSAHVTERSDSRVPLAEIPKVIARLRKEMQEAARALDFERAAGIRDRIRELEQRELETREGAAGLPRTDVAAKG